MGEASSVAIVITDPLPPASAAAAAARVGNQLLPPSPSPSSSSSMSPLTHHVKTLVGPFVSVDLGSGKQEEEETLGNKYLKGVGTQLSQMCRNRHSNSPSEGGVSKARGLLFVFSSEALWVVY